MNFEKRKTVIFMIFFTPYWVSGTKGYIAKTLFEAAMCISACREVSTLEEFDFKQIKLELTDLNCFSGSMK